LRYNGWRLSQIICVVALIKIDVDEDLLSRAVAATGLSAREAVEEALRALLRIRKQVHAGNALKGIDWEGDLGEMRTGGHFPTK
jgi:Arc/MetJ family transcription regulator